MYVFLFALSAVIATIHLGYHKALWKWFTGNSTKAELARFGIVGIMGTFWMGTITACLMPILGFWISLILGAGFAYLHNFFLNKLFGGLGKIHIKKK